MATPIRVGIVGAGNNTRVRHIPGLQAIPGVEIVIDRFHGARAYRDCADTVRKKELKRLKSQWPKAEYAEITGAMWPFRKRPGELKPEEWDVLERLFTYSPMIEAAYHLREDLTDLFDRD